MPAPVAGELHAAKELVAQGVTPPVPGAPAALTEAIVHGSHQAFMAGLHTSVVVAAGAAVIGAVLALFVRRPASARQLTGSGWAGLSRAPPLVPAPASGGPGGIVDSTRGTAL